MRKIVVLFVVLAALAAGAGSVSAHFQTFWPDSPNGYGKLGQQVSWQYFWGHPYEMVIFDAQRPGVYAVTPQGEKEKVSVEPAEMQDPATGLARKTFTFTYTPESLGDTWLVVEAPAVAIEEEDEAVQDYVKQCLHVMAEVGWDTRLGLPIELVPLTRPYGLEAGFVFKARAYLDGKPLAGATVEIEKFNGFHVDEQTLPEDQFGEEDVPMITRVAKTDVNGYVSYTLDEPGWWMVSVSAESGSVTVDGRRFPRLLRGGVWVHVEEPFSPQR